MKREIAPQDTNRAWAIEFWTQAPNPMVTYTKTFDVTNLVATSRHRHLKFNMLLTYCIGRAAVPIPEFYTLPVDNKIMQYDELSVRIVVANKDGEVNSCDIRVTPDLNTFNQQYLTSTQLVAESCNDRDLSHDCMVIGTSAIISTEIDSATNAYSDIFTNPSLIWGRYRQRGQNYALPISFQFSHAQMDGAHAGAFFNNLQQEIDALAIT